MSVEPKTLADGAIAAGLVTSPAWASWLGDLNRMLTTESPIVGLALGVARLTAFLQRRD